MPFENIYQCDAYLKLRQSGARKEGVQKVNFGHPLFILLISIFKQQFSFGKFQL